MRYRIFLFAIFSSAFAVLTTTQQQALVTMALYPTFSTMTTTPGPPVCLTGIIQGGATGVLRCNNQSDLVIIDNPSGYQGGNLISDVQYFTELTGLTMIPYSGSIPSQIGLLSKLTVLNIDATQATTFNPSIPTQIGRLTNLKTFILKVKNSTTSQIPTEIGLLTNLTTLTISGSNPYRPYSGSIPTQIGLLSNLKLLNLQNLGVNGSFPWQYVANSSTFTSFQLAGIAFTGKLPQFFRSTPTFILDTVGFTGHVPAWLRSLKSAAPTNVTVINTPLNCDNYVIPCVCSLSIVQPCSNFSLCTGLGTIFCDYTPPPTPTPLVTPTPRPVSTKATTPKATTPTPKATTPKQTTPTPKVTTPTPVVTSPTPVVTSPTMSPTPIVTPTPTPAPNDGTCSFDKCTSCVQSICTVNQIDFSHDIPADSKIVTQGVDMPAGTTMAWYVELDADGTWKCGTVVASQCVDMSGDIVLVISGNLTQDTIIDILISQNSCLNVNGSVSVGYAQSKRGVVSTVPSGCESVSATPQPSSSKFSVLLSSDTSKCQSDLKPEFVIPVTVSIGVVIVLVIVAIVIVQLRAKNKLLKRLSELQSTDKHSTMTTIAE